MANTKDWNLERFIKSVTSISRVSLVEKELDRFIVEQKHYSKKQPAERYIFTLEGTYLYVWSHEGRYLGKINRNHYSPDDVRTIWFNYRMANDKQVHQIVVELEEITEMLQIDGQNTKGKAVERLKMAIAALEAL